ncbi:hypothetical protein ACFW7J_26780 [Streptomyces sp. NPDC059525]
MLLSAVGPAMTIVRSRKGAVSTAEFAQGVHWQMPGDPTSYRFFTDL